MDIRAPSEGVILKLFAAEGDTVEVGQPLISFETDVPAETATTPAMVDPPLKPDLQPTPVESVEIIPVETSDTHGRVPLIKFRYGKGREPTVSVHQTEISHDVLDILDFPPLYGRLAVSKEEMELLEMGGAC